MAWTSPRTWVALETVTASLMNTHIRDNLNALMVVTTKGDLAVATASVTLTRLAVGSNGAVLVADSAATPGVRWSSTGKTVTGGVMIATNLAATLTAAANSDVIASFSPGISTLAKGAFTGLTVYGFYNDASAWAATGAGTITTAYGAYFSAPTIGATNWAIYVASGASILQNSFINDTSNANMTTGLTINQGPADNEILALKSSDVAHGMTSQTETDTYGLFVKHDSANGGLSVKGFSDAGLAVVIGAYNVTEDTTKSIAATAGVYIRSHLKSGTDGIAHGANANLVAISTGTGTVRFIFDSDGEAHEDVGTAFINFDQHDDIALLNLLAAKVTHKDDPIRRTFGKWLRENRSILEELKLVKFNRDGHHFINRSRTQNLLIGAMRQVGAKLEAQAERLLLLEKKVLQLAA